MEVPGPERTERAAAVPKLIESALGSAEKTVGGKFAMLIVVDSDMESPDARLRSELARVLKQYEPATDCAAYVIEGTGFKAAALRSLVTAIMVIARVKLPTKVFSTVSEAAHWMGPRLGAAPMELDPALTKFCAAPDTQT